MNTFLLILCVIAALLALAVQAVWIVLRQRHMQYWIGSYYFPADRTAQLKEDAPVDVYLAVCDHYEPEWNRPSHDVSIEKVMRWQRDYPRLYGHLRDHDGRPPQHTFFFPQDEYRPEYLDALKPLCEAGFGDVDVHLHHDNDTAASLEEKLAGFRDTLYHRHGFLRRDPDTDQIVYGFIHGNWALCNSRPDGRLCGVDQELTVLLKTGCYADFTLPSAPSPTQTKTINSIYYAQDRPGCCKSHDAGIRARAGKAAPADHLLMIQGPLLPDWSSRKFGVIPRIENGDVTLGRPMTMRRFHLWRKAEVSVAGRPDQLFIKLHTHGCKDGNIDEWLGPNIVRFHEELAAYRKQNPNLRLHYVTAWEMALKVRELEATQRMASARSALISV
ncbi:MAG TPA: hypothetical protein VM510_10750 [Caulifigura sp.]|nr:hypothetical protein [Caulifigura sp.]